MPGHSQYSNPLCTRYADIILQRKALLLVRGDLLAVVDLLASFAQTWADEPTLAYTHFQPAQPTTVGKRACLWLQDFMMDLERLKISNRATICMPYHRLQDTLEEDRLGDKAYGSTRRGIAAVYADKFLKKTLRMEDLLEETTLQEKVLELCESKNLLMQGYGHKPIDPNEMYAWVIEWGRKIRPYIADVGYFLNCEMNKGTNILFEARLGALRDIDFGIYPYTSSSQCLSAYAPIGAGIPGAKLDKVIGIMKAYSTCVGEGPFTAEAFEAEAEALRKAGGEYLEQAVECPISYVSIGADRNACLYR